MKPDREGWWLSPEFGEVEIYAMPHGGLYAWCDEVGIPGGPDVQDFTDGDDMCGHIPAHCLDDDWTFVRPFEQTGELILAKNKQIRREDGRQRD